MRVSVAQFIRYGVVGLASNALGYVFYILLTDAGVDYKLSMTLLYAAGVLQTFFFNRAWSFRHRGGGGSAFFRYCIVYGGGYIINLTALFIFVDRLSYPHQIVQGVLIVLLAILIFILQKFWVFHSVPCKAEISGRRL